MTRKIVLVEEPAIAAGRAWVRRRREQPKLVTTAGELRTADGANRYPCRVSVTNSTRRPPLRIIMSPKAASAPCHAE